MEQKIEVIDRLKNEFGPGLPIQFPLTAISLATMKTFRKFTTFGQIYFDYPDSVFQ